MIDPKILRGMSFFDDLNEGELEILAGVMKRKHYKPGDMVFKENEDGDSLYVIKKGEVKACKTSPDGELLTLVLMKDGDIFGEMSFLDGRARSATLIAIADLETYVITKADFEKLVDDNPRLIYKVLKNLVFQIHAIVRGMNTRYLDMMNYMWGRKRG
jgi:CRP/FNR family cyclic AMP-dependent transcriptional regulator